MAATISAWLLTLWDLLLYHKKHWLESLVLYPTTESPSQPRDDQPTTPLSSHATPHHTSFLPYFPPLTPSPSDQITAPLLNTRSLPALPHSSCMRGSTATVRLIYGTESTFVSPQPFPAVQSWEWSSQIV
ncbi:hypothetical protein L873DRAFT_1790268 [Choiromyces venosus 120613-1]|uniref:Uncharacterized protein n=1 Tax=Choiromyces venosus 120613-1 TaxID=1336337 RepID=A0A3N4JNB2_9PEZI|nr:hypothetical protein L873DRAFT_1790268 [Choiromyces venosus 120613-1]